MTRFIGAFAACALTAIGAGTAIAGGAVAGVPGPTGPGSYQYWGIPKSYVEVDRGKFGLNRWTLRMKRGHRALCVELAAANDSGLLGGGSCRGDLLHPPDDWQQVLGAGTAGPGRGSLVFQVTSTRVRSLKVLSGPAPLTWARVRTEALSRREARKAKLPRSFRFAVTHRFGDDCIRRVIAFDQAGQKLGEFTRPCEL
jgi:hypothetical protein